MPVPQNDQHSNKTDAKPSAFMQSYKKIFLRNAYPLDDALAQKLHDIAAADNSQTVHDLHLQGTKKAQRNSLLVHAAIGGDIRTFRNLIRAMPRQRINVDIDFDAIFTAFDISIQNGYSDITDEIFSYAQDNSYPLGNFLISACARGEIAIMATLLDAGANIGVSNDVVLCAAAEYGQADAVKLLLDHGACVNANNGTPLYRAAEHGHIDTMQVLFAYNPAWLDLALDTAQRKNNVEAARLLLSKGARIDQGTEYEPSWIKYSKAEIISLFCTHLNMSVPTQWQNDVTNYEQDCARWQKTLRRLPPDGLAACDPTAFRTKTFTAVKAALGQEKYHGCMANMYAYIATALFQSEDRVLRYMDKWAGKSVSPLHDLLSTIRLPVADLSGVNLSAWGDAILKHGPAMAKLAQHCKKIPTPEKSDDGKTWSYSKTAAIVATHAYARGNEHPQLAHLCYTHSITEEDFERALELVLRAPANKDMPDITIDGQRFDMQGATFRRLENNDARGLLLGDLTGCCQSIGGVGEDCALHGFTSENGGFYVIETEKGEIIGQSWAWRGKKGELCFDSLETLGGRVDTAQWHKLLRETAAELTARNDHNVTALHVGMGGGTPANLLSHFNQKVAAPRDYRGYRDSSIQVRVWKKETRQP